MELLPNIKAIEEAGMRAYTPLFNRDNEHGAYYGSSRFTYDAAQDRYICPNGQPLHLTRMEYKAEKAEYRADAAACNACPQISRVYSQPLWKAGPSLFSRSRTSNESKGIIRPRPIEIRPAQTQSLGGTLIRGGQRVAWDAPLSFAATLESQL